MTVRQSFAIVLRTERQNQNMTQDKLAKAAGITTKYLWRLEQGRQSPTLDVVLALCTAMNIDAGKFVADIKKNL